MKRLVLVLAAVLIAANALYSGYQTVGVYVCESGMTMAELSARTIVTRKELYRASSCKCEGVDRELKTLVKKGKWSGEGFEYEYGSCEPPRNIVYHCICIGTDSY
eukprot:TRINITY_DN22828_c0_g1_i1.p2 TRINITY_DN22828_c0_g1~~TRINITY_DN22828_c0_g1_i1.p2  ORF type:complete len:105 (+),score=0.68 TRINITY_DN22828_c0_g1_i1:448-762(+)